MVSLTFSSGGYINGRNSANLELMIDESGNQYPLIEEGQTAQRLKDKSLHRELKISNTMPIKTGVVFHF